MATINLGKVKVTPEGQYDPSKSYAELSLVGHEGSSYISIQDVPAGVSPTNTAYWQLHGSKGADGTNGADGNDGIDAYQPFKGWYDDSTTLSTAFPSPQVGDYAFVAGSTASDPVTVYKCTTAGTWAASSSVFNPANNQSFQTGQDLDQTKIINDPATGGANHVLSAEAGKTINAKVSALGPKIEQVGEKIGHHSISFLSNKSVNLGGALDVSIVLTPQTDNGWNCAVVECQGGDKFVVTGLGGGTTRLWGFTNSEDKLIAVSATALNATNLELVAPDGATHIVVNSKATVTPSLIHTSVNSIDTKIDGINSNVGELYRRDADIHFTKYINISTRQKKIQGYATDAGVFNTSGTGRFIYIPVVANVQYRLVGTYNVSASSYANILFSTSIPQNGDSGTVIDSKKGNGTPFDILYTPQSNGYVFIWARATTFYDAFYIKDDYSRCDNLSAVDDKIKYAISYTESSKEVAPISTVKGYCSTAGEITKFEDDTSAITLSYFQVEAGKTYRLYGNHGNLSYGSIFFTEAWPVTGDFGKILKQKGEDTTFDVTFTPDLDGYIFVYASSFTALVTEIERNMLVKDDVFSDCISEQVKLVGSAYQQKYIYVGTHTITDSQSNGCFVIPVTNGERYFIRAHIKSYSNYAVLGFTQSLEDGYNGAVVLKSVSSGSDDYEYTYDYTATADGYLMIWSTVSVYGSKYYVEVFKITTKIGDLYDYSLPKSLKMQLFGDSITDFYWGDMSSWARYIPDNIKTETLTVINSAVGGSGIGGGGDGSVPMVIQNGYTRESSSTFAAPLDATADLVVIFCGTNDWAAGQTLASTCSGLATALQYIFEHSKAKVLFCTPLQRYNSTDQSRELDGNGEVLNPINVTLRQECDELIKVCKRFSVQVLDLNAEANINRYNILDYSEDGLHPHRDGDIYVSWLICNKIKSMFRGYNCHL